MKKLILLSFLSATIINSYAQQAEVIIPPAGVIIVSVTTNTIPPPTPTDAGSFFQTATLYFTSFNTNYTWKERGSLSAGIDSLQGPVNLANNLRLDYEVYKNLALESSTRSSGISGTWLTQQIGPNYSFKRWDAKLTLYGAAGYNFFEPDHRYYGELGLRVSKKMTKYTFAGVGFAEQVPTKRQVYSAFAGFNF